MPEKRTIKKAQTAKRHGKSASTQAGAFVHESIEHIRKGKHGAKNAKQAIAIGLSEARRAGVAIPDKSKKKSTAKKATGRIALKKTSATRSKAAVKRLKKEPTSSVSHAALSRHARKVVHKR
ncbi:MAG: hypothetical protein H7177_14385 [Rhizobacter sp.]|nr:hypothetical protein [Bacteriovorax sp.]